jgi:hypothetical protein
MTKVTPSSIAYIATQVNNQISPFDLNVIKERLGSVCTSFIPCVL